MNLVIDADSISSKAPLVVSEVDRLFDNKLCKNNSDKPIAGGIRAGKAGKLGRPFAASFTMGQSKTNDISRPISESPILQCNCGVEDLEDFGEFDELHPKKYPQDDLTVSTYFPVSTPTAFHSGLPSSRARYNFQLGLINMAEMLPEIRSCPTHSQFSVEH
jgi:hypothetical protein